jgi:hypothetical protein
MPSWHLFLSASHAKRSVSKGIYKTGECADVVNFRNSTCQLANVIICELKRSNRGHSKYLRASQPSIHHSHTPDHEVYARAKGRHRNTLFRHMKLQFAPSDENCQYVQSMNKHCPESKIYLRNEGIACDILVNVRVSAAKTCLAGIVEPA